MKNKINILILAAASVVLAGCGGGSDKPVPPHINPPGPKELNITVTADTMTPNCQTPKVSGNTINLSCTAGGTPGGSTTIQATELKEGVQYTIIPGTLGNCTTPASQKSKPKNSIKFNYTSCGKDPTPTNQKGYKDGVCVGTSSPTQRGKVISGPSITKDNIVSAYLLLDSTKQLKEYQTDLKALTSKPNFNRLIISFVDPAMENYTQGSLAGTGIMGWYKKTAPKGGNAKEEFKLLREVISATQQRNIEVFLSVGGWNYSNPPALLKDGKLEEGVFSYWPCPDLDNSKTDSYTHLVNLASDLGVDGIDVDYEEFTFANKHAIDASKLIPSPAPTAMLENNKPTYEDMVKFSGEKTVALVRDPTTKQMVFANNATAIMPKSIEKISRIIRAITTGDNKEKAKSLKLSTAAPPVGARPISGLGYGDNKPIDQCITDPKSTKSSAINCTGGKWYGGNLKGMWYSLTAYDPQSVNRFDSLGLMTYDLGTGTKDQPYAGASTELNRQVTAYVNDYTTWLKASPPTSNKSYCNKTSGACIYLPAHFNISPKIQFGFEVNTPAYPKTGSKLNLSTDMMKKINYEQSKNSNVGGVIIWQLYSTPNELPKGTAATVQETLNASCSAFKLNSSKYNCKAKFPPNN